MIHAERHVLTNLVRVMAKDVAMLVGLLHVLQVIRFGITDHGHRVRHVRLLVGMLRWAWLLDRRGADY